MDSQWHDEVEGTRSVEETVACVRRLLGALTAEDPALPRYCRPSRIAHDDDVDDLTLRLASLRHEKDAATRVEPLFDFLLHASMHMARLNRARAAVAGVPSASGLQMRQMG